MGVRGILAMEEDERGRQAGKECVDLLNSSILCTVVLLCINAQS